MLMKDKVVVQVPGTTANLGPGFDSLGIALNIHNRLIIRRASIPTADAMIAQAGEAFFSASNEKSFPFACEIDGKVPPSRGLGSSVTVRLGTLLGLNRLTSEALSTEQLYKICAKLEGHPDNAAPATFGGFTVTRGDFKIQRFEVPAHLHFVLLVPDFEVRTSDAREIMPHSVPLKDAAFSVANASWITAAFASQQYATLRGAFKDGLHQPYRARLVPFLDDTIHAAEAAGALGGWLSGSGSTIACLTLEYPDRVAEAMQKTVPGSSSVFVTSADNQGACLIS
ncbi:MAG: homoserine kinase [Verrucomicrobia bacterium]|nr:MAG: homoserine kinase [Verrucomicrobiota bacterium]